MELCFHFYDHTQSKWQMGSVGGKSKPTPCAIFFAKCAQKNAILDELRECIYCFKVMHGATKKGGDETELSI